MTEEVAHFLSRFVGEFILPSHKPRMLYLLERRKRRGEVMKDFHTGIFFDERYSRAIPASRQNSGAIHAMMMELGAKDTCWGYSALKPLNGKLNLRDALHASVGLCEETVLYCEEANVAYWEGGHCDRLILCRLRHPQSHALK